MHHQYRLIALCRPMGRKSAEAEARLAARPYLASKTYFHSSNVSCSGRLCAQKSSFSRYYSAAFSLSMLISTDIDGPALHLLSIGLCSRESSFGTLFETNRVIRPPSGPKPKAKHTQLSNKSRATITSHSKRRPRTIVTLTMLRTIAHDSIYATHSPQF